ncbi:MAG: SPOR domain-containing protein [Gammaproteobacteria bacterium]|nr:SPOR domain-containing protein [Gammaproteobacteria bacterium]
MDQNLKNRLVGVAVIFALAVIFLPMILDGSGVQKDQLEVVIPPQPMVAADARFETRVIELQRRVEELPEPEARFVDESSPPATAQAEPTASAIEAEPETAAKTAQPAAEPETVASVAPEAKAKTGGQSWVLQVGSFQDRDKALVQRDRLRKSRIAAVFIEQFAVNGKTSYRVRLGPFLSRDQTRVAQNKIKAKHDIDGIIMKYER